MPCIWRCAFLQGAHSLLMLMFTTSLWRERGTPGEETHSRRWSDLAQISKRTGEIQTVSWIKSRYMSPSKPRFLSSWGQAEKSFKDSWVVSSADMELIWFPPKSFRTRKLSWAMPWRVSVDLRTDCYKEKPSHSAPQKKMCENAVMQKKKFQRTMHKNLLSSHTHINIFK